jgi:heme exporter protein B
MSKFNALLKFEILIHNRSYQIVRNCAYVMLLSTIIFPLMMHDVIGNIHHKMIIYIIGLTFAVISIPHYLIKIDIDDGSLEILLSVMNPHQIIYAKYCALITNLTLAAAIAMLFSSIFLGLSDKELIYLGAIAMLLLLQFTAFILLMNVIHAYFKSSTSFIITLVLPLIIPSLIISGLALETFNIDFVMILLGVDMAIIPIICFMSAYLLSNLYNFGTD